MKKLCTTITGTVIIVLPRLLLLLVPVSQNLAHAADTTLKDYGADSVLLLLRQNELQAEASIEKLNVDISVAEKAWQDSRRRASALSIKGDSAAIYTLKSSALWARLNALRNELKNAVLLKDFNHRHRELRRQLLRARSIKNNRSQTWNALADSLKVLMAKADEESSWLEEHMLETGIELKAVHNLLSSRTDSIWPEQKQWLDFKKTHITRHLHSDSGLYAMVKVNLKPRLALYMEETRDSLQSISLGQRGKDTFNSILSLWKFELWKVDGKPLTAGKIMIALLVIFLGIKIAQILSVITARILTKRFLWEEGVVDAGRKLMFYAFSIVFTLYALHSVQVPLTAFTLAGGALALGLGFGSQNILNNFISGIILLFERPIKTGDFIEIESFLGKVESIGLRSTRILTPGNLHLVLPNSKLLENTVINWTLSNRTVRIELKVGVVYGSPVEQVKQLLLKAARKVDRVLHQPASVVIFSDFGDDSLVFHLLVWIKINNIIERRIILSELRFKVNELFKQEGIVIAFPQRDVHLDTAKPLQVEIKK